MEDPQMMHKAAAKKPEVSILKSAESPGSKNQSKVKFSQDIVGSQETVTIEEEEVSVK